MPWTREADAAEPRRQELRTRADAYVANLIVEVGEPTEAEIARAEEIAGRLEDRAAAATRPN